MRKSTSAGRIAVVGKNGLSNSSMTVSKTPTPPGTWLSSTRTWAARKAAISSRKVSGELGSKTSSTATASIQSTSTSANCATTTGGRGSVIATPRQRNGLRLKKAMAAYVGPIANSTAPATRSAWWPGSSTSPGSGANARLRPPSTVSPRKKVLE